MSYDKRLLVFDTETTGIDATRRACDVALIEIDENCNELARASSLINPGIPIPENVTAIHGITDEMVKDAPTMEEWVTSIIGPGGLADDVVLIGHRISFDLPMFEGVVGHVTSTFDTLLMSYIFIPECQPDKKLDTLKSFLSLPGGGVSHRALADTETALQLLREIVQRSGRSLLDLIAVPFWHIHTCPWGKHEGTALLDVPKGYRTWMAGLDGLDPHLRKSLELVALGDPPPVYDPRRNKVKRGYNFNIPQRTSK